MAIAVGPPAGARSLGSARRTGWAWLLLPALVLLAASLLEPIAPVLVNYPRAWVVPVQQWINAFFDWLAYGGSGGISFRDLTRGLAWLLEWPLRLSENLFHRGFPGVGELPWITVVGLAFIIGHHAGGRRTA